MDIRVGSTLGVVQKLTPEGYLVCEGVPIARTGEQRYAFMELPTVKPDKDGFIVVERPADQVFCPEAMASFAGKPITIGHPSVPVTPSNWKMYSVGFIANPRRGTTDQDNMLLADLVIQDEHTIQAIRSKRLSQVSNGYHAKYKQLEPGRAQQHEIRGNHLALVNNARCGDMCMIGDSGDMVRKTLKASTTHTSVNADTIRRAFMTQDADLMEQALAGEGAVADPGAETGAGSGGATHNITVHLHGSGSGASGAADEGAGGIAEPDPMEGAPPWAQAMNERLTNMEQVVAQFVSGGDDDGADDLGENDDMAAGAEGSDTPGAGEGADDKDENLTKDSSGLVAEMQDTVRRAEILSPGIQLPTFDSKATAKFTIDAMCGLRKTALEKSLTGKHGKLIKGIVPDAGTLASMTCDAVMPLFLAASELARTANNGPIVQHVNFTGDANRKAPPTIAEINKQNRERYGFPVT